MKILLSERNTVAEGTTELIFKVPEESAETLSFSPGQYGDFIILSPKYTDNRGHSRSFSLTSAPHQKNILSIVFRNSDSAWKRSALEAQLGTEFEFAGPSGFFTLPRKTARPIVALAGGMGVAPFLSMIRHMRHHTTGHSLTLLYENRSPERAAHIEELRKSPISLVEHYGRTTPEILIPLTLQNPTALYYVAGPIGMVARTHSILRELKVDELSILTEEFTGY